MKSSAWHIVFLRFAIAFILAILICKFLHEIGPKSDNTLNLQRDNKTNTTHLSCIAKTHEISGRWHDLKGDQQIVLKIMTHEVENAIVHFSIKSKTFGFRSMRAQLEWLGRCAECIIGKDYTELLNQWRYVSDVSAKRVPVNVILNSLAGMAAVISESHPEYASRAQNLANNGKEYELERLLNELHDNDMERVLREIRTLNAGWIKNRRISWRHFEIKLDWPDDFTNKVKNVFFCD